MTAPDFRYPAGVNIRSMPILTKSDMAYWRIRAEILDGTLAPGELIDQEALAARLSFSTTPVREALRRLQSERLVVSHAHREVSVAELTTEVVDHTYTIRLVLDPLAAGLAATHATDEQRQLITQLATVVTNGPLEALHHNRCLHRAIYSASGNEELTEILDLLWDRSDRYRLITITDDEVNQTAFEEHAAIAQAVCDGEVSRASTLMERHLRASIKRIQKSPRFKAGRQSGS